MDNNHPGLTANETVQQEDISSLEKLTQSYLMLKKRICGTHEMIKQYNDKLKECEKLKQDLDAANKQAKNVTCNYNSTLAKVIKLELQNTEYKKNIESLTDQVNKSTIKAAADQQHIQQLICKIKDIEGTQNDKVMQYDLEKSSLQVKVKELEQELKNVKKSCDIKMKKMEKMEKKNPVVETSSKAKSKDVGTNTLLTKDTIMQKPLVTEKCTLTDEFYNNKEQPYPIFCAKCEVLLEPAPLEKICKIMTNSCPKLIEKISSPPRKAAAPLPVSKSKNDDQCKVESLPTLSDTPPPHVQNQNNQTDFVSTNVMPAHTMSLNRTDYGNNFSPASNLMNQGTYFIGSTPINPLSIPNSNTANQNNHCETSMATMASLSIISSLQKKIDTLETKIKKKLNKKRTEQNSSCCQHHHASPCHVYDMNNSMQQNFIELWKRMADFYENKEKKFEGNGQADKKPRKCKLSRLKLATKRLQGACLGTWKVDPAPKSIEESSPRKKPKRRKYLYSTRFNKSTQSTLNSIDSLENLDSNSDADTFTNTFNDSSDSKMNISLKSEDIPHVQVSNSTAECDRRELVNDIGIVEVRQSSVESVKSLGGETDSGILSDSIESGKPLQIDADIDICSELGEPRNVTEKSSRDDERCTDENVKLQKPVMRSPIKVTSNLMRHDRPMETNTPVKLVQKKNTQPEEVQHSDTMLQVTPNVVRKRKISELQELKKSGNRQELLRKLKNLKKNGPPVKICQNISEHQDEQKDVGENRGLLQEQGNTIHNSGTVMDEDYVPKKKPRIAHVPKTIEIEQKKPFKSSLQFKRRLVRRVENIIPQNMEKLTDLNKSTEESKELSPFNVNQLENMESTVLNTTASNQTSTEDVVENDISKTSMSVVPNENLVAVELSNHEHSGTKSDVSNFSFESSEHNATKTEFESNDQTLESEDGEINSSLNTSASSEIKNMDELESKYSIMSPEKNESKTDFSIEEICKNDMKKDFSTEDKLKSHTPFTVLQQYINKNKCPTKNCKNQHKKLLHVRLITDKFVKKQLQRLIDNDWQTSVHCDVIEKLSSTCSASIIAKGIVDFLSSEEECSQSLDKTHTPPAPLMTKSQQKIAALLIDLEVAKPGVYQFVQAGIEYKLFRLNQVVERYIIESLARMYTVLARIKKDREKVRIFCSDALYCLGVNAVTILYTVLTCWPEVFPNNESGNKLLPKCMAHLIMTQQATDFPKIFALKNLLSVYYKYPMGIPSKDLLAELLAALQEKSDAEIETAIILLAKREGTTWCYKNVIRGALLPMIINDKLANTYRAFCLLGSLMRAFPTDDKDNSVGQIVEQLCDLINSGEGSDEQKEGVVSALLSLSRHKFDEVVQNTLKWRPSAPLKSRTREQLHGLFNCRPTDFWRGYLKKNKHLMGVQRESNI